ncbi:hypothetical protein M569_14272, partial [Genlisea aurea]
MASTSGPRSNVGYGRFSSTATALNSDNQSLVVEIRRAMNVMKEIAVDLERDKRSEMVKQLEDHVIELWEGINELSYFSTALESIGKEEFHPAEELTNFSKLLNDKIASLKTDYSSSTVGENDHWLRQFREAIWNVHHEGQPMPGEEQEDIVMTSTQCNLLNATCPLTGKPLPELNEPVRSMDCKHVYEKKGIMQHIRSKAGGSRCPVAGCPKVLVARRVVCDSLLLIEIDEMRSVNEQRAKECMVEDFTAED